MLTQKRWYFRLALFTTLLALCVIILGAYTRIKDAGLGCPDWPGCYGQLIVPGTPHALAKAQQIFPEHTVEPAKAWAEMIHRYFALSLASVIVILTLAGFIQRRHLQIPLAILFGLAGLIVFQALLGKWTVTLKLLPVIVMGHLLGGLTIIALVWLLVLHTSGWLQNTMPKSALSLRPWALLGLVILAIQITLGGWTSANYAGIACPDFPFCYGNLWPSMDFKQAFQLWMPVGIDYQGGSLTEQAKITIQMMHRLGALLSALYLGGLSLRLIIENYTPSLRNLGMFLLLLLLVQIGLGIINVLLRLPLHVAVTHNAVAVLLLITLVSLNFSFYAAKRDQT